MFVRMCLYECAFTHALVSMCWCTHACWVVWARPATQAAYCLGHVWAGSTKLLVSEIGPRSKIVGFLMFCPTYTLLQVAVAVLLCCCVVHRSAKSANILAMEETHVIAVLA